MSRRDPRRGTNAYRRHAARQRALGHPCWLCGNPIDYTAPARTRWSFSLDHIVPLNHGGDLLDPHNARSSHYGCNAARGARPPADTTVHPRRRRRLPSW